MENFLKKAKEKYGDRFDYSEVVWKTNKTKNLIKCNEHNIKFMIVPSDHVKQINGGCSECLKQSKIKDLKLFNDEIIKPVNIAKYKNKYFVSMSRKRIICRRL